MKKEPEVRNRRGRNSALIVMTESDRKPGISVIRTQDLRSLQGPVKTRRCSLVQSCRV